MDQGSEIAEALPKGGNTISSYEPTPFVDQSWTVVSTQSEVSEFAPLELQSVSVQAPAIDPMFEDFTSLAAASETEQELEATHAESLNEPLAEVSEDARTEIVPDLEIESGDLQTGPAASESAAIATPGIALEEHERLLRAAREEALLEAKQIAQAEAEARVQELEAQLSAITEDLKVQVAETLLSAEHKAAELALSVARKLIGAAAEGSSEYLGPVLKEAIAAAGSADIKRIRVSPRDYETLKGLKADSFGAASDSSWTFEADESIHVGCVVVTAAGEVDFDLDKAWERIKKKILGAPGAADE